MHNKTYDDINQYRSRKHFKFGFAMTNVWRDRDERTVYIDNLMQLHSDDAVKDGYVFRFFSRAKHQQSLSNKLLPYETYLELIRSSMTTLIMPSYDSNCFSMRRFFESIANGCLPLVHEDCELYMFPQSMQDFIRRNLIVTQCDMTDFKQHVNKVVNNYDNLLYALFCQPFVQQYIGDSLYLTNLEQAKLL
jgi:hypothetical protein